MPFGEFFLTHHKRRKHLMLAYSLIIMNAPDPSPKDLDKSNSKAQSLPVPEAVVGVCFHGYCQCHSKCKLSMDL